jgi:hypothetical protein
MKKGEIRMLCADYNIMQEKFCYKSRVKFINKDKTIKLFNNGMETILPLKKGIHMMKFALRFKN